MVMTYSDNGYRRNEKDITLRLKLRQEIISLEVKKTNPDTFGVRLLKAFRDANLASNQTQIAKILGVRDSTVSGWMQAGGSYPEIDTLFKISDKTKCNLHWLLTGKGESSADELGFLNPNERRIVDRLATEESRTSEEVINSLVIEALAQRASEIFIHLNQTGRITEQERQQLVVLYDLVLDRSSLER